MKHTNKNKRPTAAVPQFEEIPEELRALKQWVLWRYIWKEDQGAWAKLPVQPRS